MRSLTKAGHNRKVPVLDAGIRLEQETRLKGLETRSSNGMRSGRCMGMVERMGARRREGNGVSLYDIFRFQVELPM